MTGVQTCALPISLLVAPGIGGHPQKFKVADTWDLNRILEAEEHTEASAFFRLKLEQVLAAVANTATGDLISGMTSEDLGEGALATAVATHDRVNFTSPDLEIHPFENRLILHRCMQVGDVEKELGVGADHSRKQVR